MKKGVRRKEGEDHSEAKLEEVHKLLTQEKPITKKEACAMINIAYNVARLQRIVDEYLELKEFRSRRRKELRNTPVSDVEISEIISSYLEEGNISEIVNFTFRSADTVKDILHKYNIPLRNSKYNYFNPPFLAEASVHDDYVLNDLVYSARYTQPAKISKRINSEVYRIWLEQDEQYAYQPYWELGDLREVQNRFNVTITDRKYWEEGKEIQVAIATTLQNAKKRKKQ